MTVGCLSGRRIVHTRWFLPAGVPRVSPMDEKAPAEGHLALADGQQHEVSGLGEGRGGRAPQGRPARCRRPGLGGLGRADPAHAGRHRGATARHRRPWSQDCRTPASPAPRRTPADARCPARRTAGTCVRRSRTLTREPPRRRRSPTSRTAPPRCGCRSARPGCPTRTSRRPSTGCSSTWLRSCSRPTATPFPPPRRSSP